MSKILQRRSGLTLVEILVTMIIMSTVIISTVTVMSLSLGRLASSVQAEAEEAQLRRFQQEVAYFVSLAESVQLYDTTETPPVEVTSAGSRVSRMVCTLDSSDTPSGIRDVTFDFTVTPGGASHYQVGVEITLPDGSKPSFVYTPYIVPPSDSPPVPAPGFEWTVDGYIFYTWSIDAGLGVETFDNMAMPASK